MTDSGFPTDLSVLAQVTPDSATEDKPPRLNEPPDYKEVPPRPTRRRGLRERATPRPSGEKAEKPRVVKDDDPAKEYRPGILVKPLTDLYKTIGMMIMPMNQPVGTAFMQNAGECAQSLDNAARQDVRVRRFLMGLLQGGVWADVVIKHMPIFLAMYVTMGPGRKTPIEPLPEPPEGDDVANPVSNGYVRDVRDRRRGVRG